MKFIADLHLHSHYSRATSKDMTPEMIWYWAQVKGIKVVGTGDVTHPLWLAELRERLTEEKEGLFSLKREFRKNLPPQSVRDEVYFMLQGEVSCIYKKGEKLRKVHLLTFFPGFDEAMAFQKRLNKIGNLFSDGRPILGTDAREVLKVAKDISPRSVLVPAHAWTPHFSIFGSESGFDSVEECFEELSDLIFSLETGLSSDPKMNWRVSRLDRFTLTSNSDAHSPKRIGREANILDVELSYDKIWEGIKTRNGFLGTIEFFPEEGKYHYDGHRACGIVLAPSETIRLNYLCPKCGQKVTVGVMHRVELLADRKDGERPKTASGFISLVPLEEIIMEAYGFGQNSKRVEDEYFRLIERLGSEFHILMEADISEIGRLSTVLAEGIRRVRSGKISVSPGYDGLYGKVRIFEVSERKEVGGQRSLF